MTYSEVVEYVKTEVRVAKHKRNWWREVPSERGKAHNAVPYLAQHTCTHFTSQPVRECPVWLLVTTISCSVTLPLSTLYLTNISLVFGLKSQTFQK